MYVIIYCRISIISKSINQVSLISSVILIIALIIFNDFYSCLSVESDSNSQFLHLRIGEVHLNRCERLQSVDCELELSVRWIDLQLQH